MYIYVICPVRNVTLLQTQEIADYVVALENEDYDTVERIGYEASKKIGEINE